MKGCLSLSWLAGIFAFCVPMECKEDEREMVGWYDMIDPLIWAKMIVAEQTRKEVGQGLDSFPGDGIGWDGSVCMFRERKHTSYFKDDSMISSCDFGIVLRCLLTSSEMLQLKQSVLLLTRIRKQTVLPSKPLSVYASRQDA